MRAVLLFLTLLLPALASATDVQGSLSGDISWKRGGSPYVLTGDVTVAWGSRLTVESGVQVIAAAEDMLNTGEDPKRVELIVDGTLLVRGTPDQPVVFTSEGGEGSWYGIRVRGGRGTVIDGALISRAQQGLELGMSATVKNTRVSAVARDCLRVSWGKPSLENNDLSGCGGGSPPPRMQPEPRSPRPSGKEPSTPVSEGPPARVMPPPPPAEPRIPSAPRESTAVKESTPASPPPEPRPTPSSPPSGMTAPMTGRASTAPSSPPETAPRVKLPGLAPETPPRLSGAKDSGTVKPETCSPIPQVGESSVCPGYRRWKKEQERLGAVPPGATRLSFPSTQLTASPGQPVPSGLAGPPPGGSDTPRRWEPAPPAASN